jgi:hypothetical protein
METYFEKLNYKNKNFYRECFDEHLREIYDLKFSDKHDLAFREALHCFEIIATKTADALNNFDGPYQEQHLVEIAYFKIVECLLNHIDAAARDSPIQINRDDLNQFNNLLNLISEQPKMTLFQAKFLSALSKNMFYDEKVLALYDQDIFVELLKTMQLDFSNLDHLRQEESSEDDNDREFKRDMDEARRIYRFRMEGFFDGLGEGLFTKHSTAIQTFYE